jgi:WD40 repeat protein
LVIRTYRFFSLLLSGVLLVSVSAFGEGTHSWEQSSFTDLSKGTAKSVSIRSTGGLELAPAFKALTTTPSTYIWAIASGHEGEVYAATGAPARIYRITPDGKSSAIFQPQELQVQALVVDKNGVIYAATNPDGKVYRITPPAGGAQGTSSSNSAWTSSLFFDPGTKYIWDLAFDQGGNLYVATGDHGEVFRVTPSGEHSVFFKSDEAHIRVLTFDHKGNLIAGSDGSGLIYRISPKGEAFVLYSAPKKEITALAIDAEGNIYAAGTGEKQAAGSSLPLSTAVALRLSLPANQNPVNQNGGTPGPGSTPTSLQIQNFPAMAGESGNSEIYRIAPDGAPSRIWSSHGELVYALAFDSQGRLLAGTGNQGRIFAITGEDSYADLLQASASQVTAFAKTTDGALYAATSNLGKLYLLGASPNQTGTYESDIFDAHNFSRWGRIEFRGKGNVGLFARSGNVDNPDRNWSAWQKVVLAEDGSGPITVPSARFVQWKTELQSGNPEPQVDSVIVNYLPKNVPPDFDDVSVQAGVRFQALPKIQDASGGNVTQHFDVPPTAIHDPHSVAVKWAVHDDNGDQMVYSIYYRGDGESRWLLLKGGITDKFYSFDASLLPDGGYTIKVLASDAPSHSPGEGLTSERESTRFEIDTTPPQIEGLIASQSGDRIRVQFHATDSFSNIKRAEYSVDASDWQYVEPADQLSDSRAENYDFLVALQQPDSATKEITNTSAGPMAAEHVIVVRVYDAYDNLSSAKFVLRTSNSSGK